MKRMVFFILLSFVACYKNSTNGIPFPQPNDCSNHKCDTSKLEVVWQIPLSPKDTAEMISSTPLFYNGNVLFTRGSFGETCSDTLKMFDAKTGNLLWTWSEYFYPSKFNEIHGEIEQSGKYALFTTEKEFYCIDLTTGKTTWRTYINIGVGYPGCNVQNGYVYQPRTIYNKSDSSYSDVLYRSKVETESWEPLFTQKTINDYKPGIQLPVIWINPKGEEVALFQIRYINFKTQLEKADFITYNLVQNKVYFGLDSIDGNYSGSVVKPYVNGNTAFIATTQIVYSIDLNTKKVNWQKKFTNGGFNGGQTFALLGEKLFVKLNSRILYTLDPKSGNDINIDTDNGSSCHSKILFFNNKLFYSCSGNGSLYAIDILNGTKIWAEPSPNNYKGTYNNNKVYESANIGECGIAIDTANKYLYASDYYFAMCLKLPKR